MEAHPVPKNVLTVEFKLFGSLTVRQFVRILGGCLFGLVLFLSPIPKVITIPLVVAIVFVSVMSALVKDFQVRFFGFMRSVFVSPQYVWKKESPPPSVLADDKKAVAKEEKKSQDKGSNLPAAVDPDDLMIEKLLAARSGQAKQVVLVEDENTAGERDELDFQSNQSLERAYSEAFGDVKVQRPPVASIQPVTTNTSLAGQTLGGAERIGVGPTMQVAVNSLKGRPQVEISQNTSTNVAPTAPEQPAAASVSSQTQSSNTEAVDPLQQRIQQSSASTKAAAAEINQIYNQAHAAAAQEAVPQVEKKEERYIYGLAVDHSENPVSDANVSILDANSQVVAPVTSTGSDGRFALHATELPFGGYVIHLEHPQFKFYDFKINYEAGKLPAYKFRAQ